MEVARAPTVARSHFVVQEPAMTCSKAAARAASAALCLGSLAARADVLTQGVASVRQPAVGAAIDDTPAALSENPGGLGFVTALSLDYLRQQAFRDRQAADPGVGRPRRADRTRDQRRLTSVRRARQVAWRPQPKRPQIRANPATRRAAASQSVRARDAASC